jgi:flagellar biosynthesis protein
MEKQQKAAALGYNPKTNDAPQVLALGRGFVAHKIMELATENGIPLHKDPALVEKLINLDLSHEIPPELYAAVAAVLSFIYRADGRS